MKKNGDRLGWLKRNHLPEGEFAEPYLFWTVVASFWSFS